MVQGKGCADGARCTVHGEVTIRVSRGDGVEDVLRNTWMEDRKKQCDRVNKRKCRRTTEVMNIFRKQSIIVE